MTQKRKVKAADIIPFAAFIILLIFFAAASKGKMLSAYNLRLLVEESIQTIVVGCGVLFVVAQGSIDLTVGVNLALSGVIGMHVATMAGVGWLAIPVSIICGTLVGLLNGFLVAKCKVPSFTLSIAMLIGVRGIVNFIQTKIGIEYVPDDLRFITTAGFRFTLFAIILVAFCYIFEFTRVGRYSQAIGENETTTRFIGIPVTKYKMLAFVISGFLAGVGAVFSMGSVGGTSMQMGVFLEMRTAMAVFFGGILVTGGSSAKFYKVILGSLSITVITTGLSLIGLSDSQYSESIEGILLLIILFITIVASRTGGRKKVVEKTPHTKEAGAQS